jgi:membrane-bound ClpP family serine protease
MSQPLISDEVRALLVAHVRSHEQLETLLLLHRKRDQEWTVMSVSEALNISASAAAEALSELASGDLVELLHAESVPPRYRAAKTSLGPAVEHLAQAYSENRIELMKVLSANAIERVRTGALRAFADALVIGRKRNDG